MIHSVWSRLPKRAAPIETRSALPPVVVPRVLRRPLGVLWLIVAAASLILWIVETPLLYNAALHLQNTNGMFTLRPAQWRVGLHSLGLSPAVYAVDSMASLSLMTATMFLVGLVIFIRRSSEWIALLVSYTFVNLGVGIINAYAGGPALTARYPNVLPFLNVYSFLSSFSFYALFVIPLLFPDGRFVPRWMRWVVPVVLLTFLPIPMPDWIASSLQTVLLAAVLLSPLYRFSRISDPAQREQTKWVTFGLLVALCVFLSLALIQTVIPGLNARPEHAVLLALVGGTIANLAFSFLPIAFGIAILRYRLWDIDVLINRTLVYGSLTISLAALYIGGVIALQSLARAITGESSELAVAVTTLVIAALFTPWRHRLQHFIDRRFYRRKYDAARTLAALSVRLRDEVDLDQLSSDLLFATQETLQPASATLWVRGGVE